MGRPPTSFAALAEAPPNVTTPALLAVFRAQAKRRRPVDLLGQWERDGYVQPSPLDGRTVNRLDGLALAAAAEFEALVLSPVAPLGSCSAIAPTSQDRTLSANRGTEVVSDPTNALALECARRLRVSADALPRLCTAQQVLRCQPLPKMPGVSRHFRMFAMVEAGRARPDDGFEVDAVDRQIDVLMRLCDGAAAMGYRIGERWIALRSAQGHEVMAERIAERLRSTNVAVARETLGSSYYAGVRALLFVRTPDGVELPIGDVGRFDWMARLTANGRMRMVASGFGLQLLPLAFGG